MERKYIAFISYRHADLDSAVAKQVHTLIEQYVIPKKLRKNGKRLGLVFRDQEELPISSNLSDDICQALDNSQFLIVICSKNTAQSPWVGREIEYFLSHHDQQHTLAVLASGEPQDVFPKALTIRPRADGTMEDVEPLAVDVRADNIPAMKKKLRQEIKRLYAALIGCPYDALVMREQKRRQRQLASVMGTILAVLGSFTAMTLVKNHEIDQKNEELAGMNLTLEEKNEELSRQKEEILLRESELLTEKGMAAIQENDTQTALENLVSALPNSREDRPYYAPAEQGLISALEILDEDRKPMKAFGSTLEQRTPISSYEISADGSKIMTLDDYGLLTCFQTNDDALLWTNRLSKEESFSSVQRTIPYPENNSVLIYAGGMIYSVGFDSGEILWSHNTSVARSVFLSPDRRMLVYYGKYVDNDMNFLSHFVMSISPETGEVIREVEFVPQGLVSNDGTNPYLWSNPATVAGEQCENGAFSSDGTYFAYTYSHHDHDGNGTEYCAVVNLTNGESREVVLPERNFYSGGHPMKIYFTKDDSALLFIRSGEKSSRPAIIEAINIETGKLLWQTELDTVEGKIFMDYNPMFTAVSETELFVGRYDTLYYFDIATGELIGSYTLPSQLIHMEWVEKEILGILLGDGRYTLAWGNPSGIYLADFVFSSYVTFGACTDVRMWQQGPLRIQAEAGKVTGVTTGALEDGYGFAAVIPEESNHTVKIKRLVSFQDLLEIKIVDNESMDGLFIGTNLCNKAPKGTVLLRNINYDYATTSTTSYTYYMVDIATGEYTSFETQGYLDSEDIWFTSDGQGCIFTDSLDDMKYLDLSTGKETVLQKNSQENVKKAFRFSGSVLDETGQVLTAALGYDTLRYWLDGNNQTEVPIPEEFCLVRNEEDSHLCFMGTDNQGYIICGLFNPGGDTQFIGGAAYSIFEQTWYTFAENWDSDSLFVSTARKHPWVAYNISGNLICVQDFATGKEITRFSIDLDPNSLDSVSFCADDQYFIAETMDRQIFIFDVESGELKASHQLDEDSDGLLQAAIDPEGSRMYLWYSGAAISHGVCLDMESWTKLAQIPDMIHYDADQDLICSYVDITTKWVNQLHFFRLPAVAELVDIAEGLLAQ